jgi:hypothetical protein
MIQNIIHEPAIHQLTKLLALPSLGAADAPPAGDWRAHNLGQKYAMSRQKEEDNSNLPFGWGGELTVNLI